MYVFAANGEEEEEEGWNEEASRKVLPFVRVSRSTFSSNFSFLSPVCFVVSMTKIFIPPSLLLHRSVATRRKKRRPRLAVNRKISSPRDIRVVQFIGNSICVTCKVSFRISLLLLRWKSGTTIVTHRAKVRITEFLLESIRNIRRGSDPIFLSLSKSRSCIYISVLRSFVLPFHGKVERNEIFGIRGTTIFWIPSSLPPFSPHF